MFATLTFSDWVAILLAGVIGSLLLSWWLAHNGYDKLIEQFAKDYRAFRLTRKPPLFFKAGPAGVIFSVWLIYKAGMQPNEYNAYLFFSLSLNALLLVSLGRDLLAFQRHKKGIDKLDGGESDTAS